MFVVIISQISLPTKTFINISYPVLYRNYPRITLYKCMARKTKQELEKVVDELRSLVQTGEILRYSEGDLEKKFSITRKTLRKHLNQIKAEVGTRDIKVITLKLMDILEEMMGDIERYWREAKENGEEKRMNFYMNQMFNAIEKFTNFLERFGIKPKAAENINFSGEVTSKNFEIQIIDDRRAVEDENPND